MPVEGDGGGIAGSGGVAVDSHNVRGAQYSIFVEFCLLSFDFWARPS